MKIEKPAQEEFDVAVYWRDRYRFEWRLRKDGKVLASGFSKSVAKARLDGGHALARKASDWRLGEGAQRCDTDPGRRVT